MIDEQTEREVRNEVDRMYPIMLELIRRGENFAFIPALTLKLYQDMHVVVLEHIAQAIKAQELENIPKKTDVFAPTLVQDDPPEAS